MAIPEIPPVPEMIASHTLAKTIITRHNTPHRVLDDRELSLLKQFAMDPTSGRTILESEGMLDDHKGSLVGYCVARNLTDNPAFLDPELVLLRDFFASLDVDLSTGARPMLRTHSFAYNLINRSDEIFDAESRGLAILKSFCADPTPANKLAVLEQFDMSDDEEQAPGACAMEKYGSLAGYCVATYGTEKSALLESEVHLLGEWFANGGPADEAE